MVESCPDSPVQLALSDIESGQDSTILVRERTRKTKLRPAFAKRHGKILSSTPHTISFLPAGRSSAVTLSKRDVAYQRAGNIHPIGDLVHPGTCCSHRSVPREEEHGRDQQPTCSSFQPLTTRAPPQTDSDDSVIYVKTIPESKTKPPSRDSFTQTGKVKPMSKLRQAPNQT